MFLIVRLLAASRERALVLVREKTGELRHQALHDALTGLPNRALVADRAERMLARARRDQTPIAALYVDIDGFKQVNDTFGHGAGDELLRVVATRLGAAVRDSDTVGRLGGDEFVVLADSSSLDAGPELVAERILDVLHQPVLLEGSEGRPLSFTASIGIALGMNGTPEELLRDADLALYEAKRAGKDRYATFESEMQTAAQTRMTLEMDLRDALDAGDFFLLYQPTFDLRTGIDDRRRGADPLAPSPARHPRARGLHPAHRGERPDRADRRLGAARGLPTGRRVAPGGTPAAGGRERLGAPARPRRPRRRCP